MELGTETDAPTLEVLKIWDLIHKKSKWKFNSPFPLKGTSYFAPGKESLYGDWIKDKDAQLKDIMEKYSPYKI